jgi:hypothetical protein
MSRVWYVSWGTCAMRSCPCCRRHDGEVLLDSVFGVCVQTIMRKVAVLMESQQSFTRMKRVYVSFINKTSGSSSAPSTSSAASTSGSAPGRGGSVSATSGNGSGVGAGSEADAESPFAKPQTLLRLGNIIMSMKVGEQNRRCPSSLTGFTVIPLRLYRICVCRKGNRSERTVGWVASCCRCCVGVRSATRTS